MKRILLLSVLLVAAFTVAAVWAETSGGKKRTLKPHEYGTVVMNKYSVYKDIAPVVFPHWLHRSKYSCRLCHVDIGFGMKAGSTGVTCEDNKKGIYCGSCHNGKESFSRDGEEVIAGKTVKNCDRCHSYGKNIVLKNDFYVFRNQFKKERFGNGIDWLNAEQYGRIKLKDELPDISIPREKLADPKDITLLSSEARMPTIIFSHKKHAVWSGCELCHPEIFGIKTGAKPYSMQDIFDGRFCGACHGTVAFPNTDCSRCHRYEVYTK